MAEMDAYYAALSRAYGFEVVVPRAMMAMVGQGLTVAGRTSEVIVTGVSLILEPVFQHSETWQLTKTISLAIAALERRARPQRAPQP